MIGVIYKLNQPLKIIFVCCNCKAYGLFLWISCLIANTLFD